MAIYILIHGGRVSTETWNKLTKRNDYPLGQHLGGEVWKNVIPTLEAQHHQVFTPTLGDERSHSLTDHIKQVCELITKHNLKDIILVGHSYGGMVITGVASQMADRIRLLVYLDAAFPEPKQSLCDLLALGGFNPADVLGGFPEAYTEKLEFDSQLIKSLPKVYIFCTKSEFLPLTNLMQQRIAIDRAGWNYFELPSGHIPQATVPDKLTKLLLRFCD